MRLTLLFFYLRKYLNNLNKVTSYWEQLQACLWARSHKHKSVMSRPVSLAILFTFKIEIQTGYGDCLVLLWHEYVAGVEHWTRATFWVFRYGNLETNEEWHKHKNVQWVYTEVPTSPDNRRGLTGSRVLEGVNELTFSNCLPHNDDSLLAEACKLQNNTELLTVEKKADIVETGFETCQERSEWFLRRSKRKLLYLG